MAQQTTSGVSQTVLPSWYTNYAQQILSNQQAVAERPYTAYTQPRIAGFTEDQQAGFDATRNAAGAYSPALALGTLATASTLGNSAAAAGADDYAKALSINPSAEAGGYLNSAQQQAQEAKNPYGITYAKPYLDAAAGNVADASEYMDPYIENVVNRYGELGARTLREQLMPQLVSKYIGAGQLGYGPHEGGTATPSGYLTDSLRALRDVQEGVGQQQLSALSQGWTNAQGQKTSDLNRYATLGSTAGNIGTAQSQTALGAAQTALGAGQTAGNLAAGQAALAAQVGQAKAANSATDTANMLAAGAQLGQQGAQAQQLGLTGAGALTQVGQQQQQLNQQNLSQSYQDFLNQQNYPQQQIDQQTKTLAAVSPAVPQAQAFQQQQTTSGNAPTAAQALASGVAAIKALGS